MKKKSIQFSPPDITDREINSVVETLQSGWITTGPKTKEFELKLAQHCDINKFVCLNSATAAMELTLRLLGIGVGDEVIVPAYTYTATCSVVCHVGATPIMVDVQKNSYEMDYLKLSEAITDKTKVIIPVDIAGILCDYKKINEIVEHHRKSFVPNNELQNKIGKIIIMADCAHGFGAMREGVQAGNFADFTCFSFHAVKNLTTAEGGAVTWRPIEGIDDNWLYEQYQLLSLHGQTKDALSKSKLGAWEYDIVSPAYKCNMTDLQAAIGLAQLERYPEMLRRRHEIINMYDNGFKDLPISVLNHHDSIQCSSGHLYFTRAEGLSLQQRNNVIVKMAERGISCNVHYKPLPLLTAYKNLGFKIEDYPNAYELYVNQITLPLYSALKDEDIEWIIACFKEVLNDV